MEICIGMRVLVTENIEKELDLTNGTRGEVVDIVLDPREPPLPDDANTVLLHYLPPLILVRVFRDPSKSRTLPGLEQDVTPIEPATHWIQINDHVEGREVTKRIKRRQYAMTGAYALTDCRAQGLTLDSVIVDIAKPPDRKGLSMFNIYVALSRSRGRDRIRLLRDFDNDLLLKMADQNLRDDDQSTARADARTERVWWNSLTEAERDEYARRRG
jgi:ATP-dependent exoDNAse (exonuclease V) alpha subunit